jgi:NAD dependent epimerase/dehydratase
MWNNRNILITGADGFIGSHLTEALIKRGARVTALALYNAFDRNGWLDELDSELRANIRIVRGDVRDAGQMRSLCDGQDTIFHLAALIGIPYSYVAPASYVQVNVEGTLNILEAARLGGASRVVHTSTSEVYGTALRRPIDEDHPLQGQSPYSASKIGADMMAEAFARSFSVPIVTLRPFNTYGPRQSERAVLPTVIRQALDPKCKTILVGDLTPARDFTFIDDTVEAFIAVGNLDASYIGKTYNAGTGHMVTIGEAVEAIRRITGCEKPVVQEDARRRPANSEVMALQADHCRLTAATGWKPKVSLEDGLMRTADWWRARDRESWRQLSYMT